MTKLLIICGPTATGKTALAIDIAKKFGGEIVSADSRQVYKEMDIGTGKDLPKGSTYKAVLGNYGFYEIKGVKIWGYDLVEPTKQFSVANYTRFAQKTIQHIIKRGKLPILVGGTGLYIKAVVDGIPTAFIPKNESLRKNLAGKTLAELFENLAQLDPIKAALLNVSDRKNPRRLIRAIEVAQWRLKSGRKEKIRIKKYDSLFIGLNAPKNYLFEKIEKRVDERINRGLEREIKKLFEKGVTWESQAMSSLGYRQWKLYFEKKETRDKVIDIWKNEEKKYAKRQITWFKKDKRINWFDISKRRWRNYVEKLIKKWYSNANVSKN